MVRIGIVGIGFMGRIHFLAGQRLTGAKVTAICSRDAAKRAGDWRNTRGNFGPEPGQVDLSGVKTYAELSELLADPDIDLIDICTVTDQHAPLALAALNAGKHVLVEKAIALSTGRRRRDGRCGQEGRQIADGRARAAVLPGVPLRGRSHPQPDSTGRWSRRTSSA